MVTLLNNRNDAAVSAACRLYDDAPENLLEILHEVQKQKGYLSEDALVQTANILNISHADIHGIVSFYHDFHRKPQAALDVQICRGEACQAIGAASLIEDLERRLHRTLDETDPTLTLTSVFCLGNCALGPAIRIGDDVFGRVTTERVMEKIESEKGSATQ